MRILMIAHSNAPWTPLYARYLRERGDTIFVVSFHPDLVPGLDPTPGVEQEFVGAEPFDKYRNKSLFLTRLPRIRRILRRFRPDLVFAPYLISNGLVGALLWRGPLVVSAMGGDVLEHVDHPAWRRRIRAAVVRAVCARADAVHAVSANLVAALQALGVDSSRVACFPVGIDLERFVPAPDAPRAEARRLVCTRSHAPVYDIPVVIEALAALRRAGRDFHCSFVGGGHLLEAHRRLAEERSLADCTHFTGPLAHEALPEQLRAAEVYVSAAQSDGASASLLEAMATGLLPVVTRVDANLHWLRDGETGLLFESGDAVALARCLERALDDAELRARALRENPPRVRAEGDQAASMARLRALFERVLAEQARAQSGT